jgi:hypothetical protein
MGVTGWACAALACNSQKPASSAVATARDKWWSMA